MAVAKFFEDQTAITVSQGVTTAAYLNDAGGFPMSLPNQATTALIDRFMSWVNFKEVISHWLGNKAAIEFMGLTFDGDDPVLMKATMIGTAISMGKPLGELYFLNKLKLPVAFDKTNPELFFPGKCLDTINIFEDIAVANWPDLVPDLRAELLKYNEGITGEKSAFDVTDWDITSNVATLTFANTTAELAILAALVEDNLVHGSYTNWRSITLGSAIGDISSGEYAITNIDASLREITFAFSSGNNSGSGAFTTEFYTNRVPGSTTTARLYEATGETLVGANYADGEYIGGLRKRDAMQRITGEFARSNAVGVAINSTGLTGPFSLGTGYANATGTSVTTANAIAFDTADSVSPNAAKTNDMHTRVNSNVGHLYIHGKSYVA